MSLSRLIILPTILLTLLSSARGQASGASTPRSSDTRTFSVYTAIGFLEIGAIGAQYQIDDNFGIGVKADGYFLGGPAYILPNGARGGGIKFSYFFDRTGSRNFYGTNAINLEVSYLSPDISKEPGRSYAASGIELTVGHDSIKDKGLGILWATGGSFSCSTGLPPLFFPAFKVGLHMDF